jgi:1,4-dihydroxy-2-naphthoate octaprenyltransferase
MASLNQWVEGARPRTLPAAIAPVLIGTAIAYVELHASSTGPAWSTFAVRAILALLVALALQIGVNYSNDYSDGIRGTDEVRVGPVRLVGQKLASPASVKLAAFGCFSIAALGGLVLVALTGKWWLVLVGLAAIVAAWFYTGGKHPYGYAGLGELFVFVFFGLVAVMGSTYVQTLTFSALAVIGGIASGLLSVSILIVNNLRDIPTDRLSGKRTLAVRIGDNATRNLYSISLLAPFVLAISIALMGHVAALLALAAIPLALSPLRIVRSGSNGRDLIPALAGTGKLLLAYAVLLSLGLMLSG